MNYISKILLRFNRKNIQAFDNEPVSKSFVLKKLTEKQLISVLVHPLNKSVLVSALNQDETEHWKINIDCNIKAQIHDRDAGTYFTGLSADNIGIIDWLNSDDTVRIPYTSVINQYQDMPVSEWKTKFKELYNNSECVYYKMITSVEDVRMAAIFKNKNSVTLLYDHNDENVFCYPVFDEKNLSATQWNYSVDNGIYKHKQQVEYRFCNNCSKYKNMKSAGNICKLKYAGEVLTFSGDPEAIVVYDPFNAAQNNQAPVILSIGNNGVYYITKK